MLINLYTLVANNLDFGTGFEPPSTAYSEGSTTQEGAIKNLELFLSNLIGFLTILASLFFLVYFFVASFQWVTSGGDSGKAQKARDRMLQGALGLIIIIAAYSIIGLIGKIVGLDILNPREAIERIIPT
ncbi:MAG: hypothetical protein PVJ09_02875 [Candidatus Woesebacteria bacterium]|jgi:hypothetical protein